MKVLQTIPTTLASWGGPSTCTCDLLEGLYKIGASVNLLSIDTKDEVDLVLGKGRPWMNLVPNDWRSPLALSKNFKNFLLSNVYDIYHANTIWLYPSHITCEIARKNNKPYIISTHGMLYPTALKVKYWKKWPIERLWVKEDINKATCIHATCQQEMDYIRDYGYKGEIAVIPNPVVIPDDIKVKTSLSPKLKIGYLGRLHPIKKVECLLYGASKALEDGYKDFEIEIMGKGSNDYEEFLRKEVSRLGLDDKVIFVGFVNGKEKYKHLSEIRALFVTSVQENFGMIVAESLICGTPVFSSLGTPWKELNEYNCGWWKENDENSVSEVIKEIFHKSEKDLINMGLNGRDLIENKYEQSKVANMMNELYKYVAGDISKPDFVYEY